MVHKTKGIVLRTVKYGETSLIVTVFTDLFGLQSYMVNGIRTTSKNGSAKGIYFQPASQLDLVVYQNQFKNLQRIKEYKWAYLYKQLLSDVVKNAVAVFMIELLNKSVKEPEPNSELYAYIEDALIHLDESNNAVTANFPLFFSLHLAVFFGFRIGDNYSSHQTFLDLQEGSFVSGQPGHAWYLEGREAEAVSHLLKILQPEDLEEVKLNVEQRRRILNAIETYFALHIPDFGTMRTLPVLRELSG